MAYAPHPDFSALYFLFATVPDSLMVKASALRAQRCAEDPLLVTTGTDLVLFPGSGERPLTESFRISTRGFVELTSISHLGLAVPYIIRMRDLGDPAWRTHATSLIDLMAQVRAINSESYWRDTVAVSAWSGLEAKITDLVDYSCAVTTAFVSQALHDPETFTFEHLRDRYLDPTDSPEVPVPINDMMVGTFSLVFLDLAHRIIRWLDNAHVDWRKLMVLVTGRAGRMTAGLTWPTNNMCHLLWQASGRTLSSEQLYIAPHAPGISLADLSDDDKRSASEQTYRRIWSSTRMTVEVGREMFEGYAAFRPELSSASAVIDDRTRWVSALPTARSADDRRAFITRMRLVMEDPAQLVSNAPAHYLIDQLCAHGNDPRKVIIPGFTNVSYPRRASPDPDA